MASSFLTQQERIAFGGFPPIDDSIMQQYFYIRREDKPIIESFYGTLNRVAVFIQIGLLRYIGYLPDDWEMITPAILVKFVLNQIKPKGSDPINLKDYTQHGKIRTEHLQQILKHYQLRKWQPMDAPMIEKWLVHQGMEHDNQRWLLEKLCSKLLQDKIIRPSIGTLERIVLGIEEQIHQETYGRLSNFWTTEFEKTLDNLLVFDTLLKQTKHRWLSNYPVSSTAKSINEALEKIAFLKGMFVHQWDLTMIPVNRQKKLANVVRNNTNQYLQRMSSPKRHPALVCFLRETLLEMTDTVISMYQSFWIHAISEAKKAHELYQINSIKTQKQAVSTLTKASEMLLDDSIENNLLRDKIFENLSKEQIKEAIDTILKINKPLEQSYFHFLIKSYGRFKQFTPKLLQQIEFKMAFNKDNFEKGLAIVKELQSGMKRKIPESAPTNFISQTWQKVVFEGESIQNQAYELCVLLVLRDRLLSGDVFIELSRKYADFNSFLIPKQRWLIDSKQISLPFGGLDLIERIDEKVTEFKELLPPLKHLLKSGVEIRIEDGVLIVPPLEAETLNDSVKELKEQIKIRLPKVGIVEMIKEVDSWVNYSKEFSENAETNSAQSQVMIYAALLSNACNLSLMDLARSSEIDYRSLWWVANNNFSDENIKKANDLLVNFHSKQWLSAYWGSGTLSSSDGQRFATSGKIRNATALPKYFGYGKGITFYTHTADQYSQYGSKVIPTNERDATYVLDEILTNETDLNILEHTTDTHGYTDLNFALFDLVGKTFAPRIRDIKNQRLYKIKIANQNVELDYPELKFTGTVSIDYLKSNVDELQRVAASILTGTVSASLLISKLQAYPRQNNLMYVLQTYGQLCKTIFIFKYLLHLPLRHRINTQLNKGEQLHNLRSYLWFGGDGIIRKKQENEQQITARMLNLLTNIVTVWNTVYIQEVLKQLQKEGFEMGGQPLKEDDFVHISPAPFEHINRLGKYTFNSEIKLEDNGLRPLRNPKTN